MTKKERAKVTREAVADIRSKRRTYEYVQITAANGYDGIRFKRSSVKVVDAERGLIQMRVHDIIGA